jgi:hypothetical protein
MADEPHIALLPHMADDPHIALLPHIADDPHIALLPHSADDPHMAEFEWTNCEEPQTDDVDHMAEVFHTADGFELMYTLPVLGS